MFLERYSKQDILNTLVHEMIHVYLMLRRKEDSQQVNFHGPNFKREMRRINGENTGLKVSIDFEPCQAKQ